MRDTLLARDYKDPKLIIEKTNKLDGTTKTILTGADFRNHDFLLIKNATKKGFLEAEEGDGIDISTRMETHRGTVQKGKSQTLTTAGGANVGVVIKEDCPKVEKIGNYSPSGHNASSIVDVGGGSTYCNGKSWNDNGSDGK